MRRHPAGKSNPVHLAWVRGEEHPQLFQVCDRRAPGARRPPALPSFPCPQRYGTLTGPACGLHHTLCPSPPHHRNPSPCSPQTPCVQQGPLLHQQFDSVAAARPTAICLVDDASGTELTYGQVAEAAGALARTLARLGVGRDMGEWTGSKAQGPLKRRGCSSHPALYAPRYPLYVQKRSRLPAAPPLPAAVGILVERSPAVVIAMLAVLKVRPRVGAARAPPRLPAFVAGREAPLPSRTRGTLSLVPPPPARRPAASTCLWTHPTRQSAWQGTCRTLLPP